ncbi:hypothetical protein [Bacteroides acidifaciens]|uniref:hypothetical protein n=1 Tax=Bacteroides acidifaciens TaxID=85831 RepID=UPI002557FB14|nr:hypothetical protein [Bacteroides acidifaciens]
MKTILSIVLTACVLIGCSNQTTSLTPQEKAFAGKYYAIKNDTIGIKQIYGTIESYTDYKTDRSAYSYTTLKLFFSTESIGTITLEYEMTYNSDWKIRNDTLFESLIPDSYKMSLKNINQQGIFAEKISEIMDPYTEMLSAHLKETILKNDAVKIVEITPEKIVVELDGVNETIKKVK